MNWDLYIRLSLLMALEYAVWAAWMPVLAVRLLGPLKMTGKQTGWIYATFPLACIFSPLLSGYLADGWFDAKWILVVSHAVGAVLLVAAARQTKFLGMFCVMLAYSIFYTGTLPLVNKMLFEQIPDSKTQDWVFFWGPVIWASVGYFLTGLRQWRKSTGDGPDSLYLAASISVLMVIACLFQLPSPHKATANPIFEAVGMLKNVNYLVFILAQLVVAGMMQFYFLGTGQFMQDRGVSGRNISAAMGIAQAVQAAATILLLGWLLEPEHAGPQWTFVIGAMCWTLLYVVYLASKGALPIVLIQACHGLAYVFFMIAGQKFVGTMAPPEIGASAQSILFIATTGIGLFLGTQLAGTVMEKNTVGGKFQWSKIWAVPLGITLAGAIVLAVVFKAPSPAEFQKDLPAQDKALAVASHQ